MASDEVNDPMLNGTHGRDTIENPMIGCLPAKRLSAQVACISILAIIACAVVSWLGSGAKHRNELRFEKAIAIDRDGVKYEARQVSAPPYPYQAVRVQWRVVNDRGVPLLRCAPPDALFESPSVLREHERRPVRAHGAMVWIDSPYRNTPNTTTRERRNGIGYPLLPGECSSGSGSLAATWARNNKPLRVGDPVFTVPGRYRISVTLSHPRQERPSLAIEVEVLEPQGAEKQACDALEDDRVLRSALMSPVDVPGFSLAPRLRRFIDQYGKTSYADYARFALARHFLRGAGPRTRKQGSVDEIAASLHTYFNPTSTTSAADRRTVLRERLRHYFFPAGFSREASDAIDAMATAAVEPNEPRFTSAARTLASLIHVSAEERQVAIELLDELKSSAREGFAYMPNVLIALKCALEAEGSARSKEIRDVLETTYPDAIEVVEELAHEIPPDIWREFRVKRCAYPRRSEGQRVAVSRPPLTLHAARISSDPFPYQAVRVSWHVCNFGEVTLGPRSWTDEWLASLQCGQTEKGLRRPYLLIALHDRISGSTPATPFAQPSQGRAVTLGPKECCELSAALAADWSNVAGELRVSQPLFPVSGSYVISATYTFDRPTERQVILETAINVREPSGNDLAACNALTEDVELRNALISPIGAPPLSIVPRLEKFLADYNGTSYANYARFALARHYMRASGSGLQRDRLGAMRFAEELINQHYPVRAKDALRAELRKWAAQRATLDEVANKAVDDAVSHYFIGEHPFRRDVEILAGATGTSRDACSASLDILKKIVATGDGGFAYMPHVFIAIAECARLTGTSVGDMRFVLRAEYSDAAEVIDYFASELPEQEWQAFRVSTATEQLNP